MRAPDARTRRIDAASRRGIEEQIAVDRMPVGGREYFSDTRTGPAHRPSISRGRRTSAARRSARPAVDLIIEESPDALLVFRRGMSEEAFEALARRTLAHPAFMVASDGIYHGARPHPRGYGCYAQVLGHVRARARRS